MNTPSSQYPFVPSYNKEQIQIIVRTLRKLGRPNSKPSIPGQGICNNVYNELFKMSNPKYFHMSNEYKYFASKYKNSSGDIYCPVKHPTIRASLAYWILSIDKWEGEYGDNRRAFARYLMRCFQKYLKTMQ